jgi:hypothetical protein
MKIYEYVYKFTDNDLRKCFCIDIQAYSTEAMEWTEKVGQKDMSAYLDWLVKHKKFEFETKEKVHNFIRDRYFAGAQKTNISEFADYIVMCKSERTESEVMNLNSHSPQNGEKRMKKVFRMELCMVDLYRGKWPEPWTEAMNYPVEYHNHAFEFNENGDFKEVGHFQIPKVNSVNSRTMSMTNMMTSRNTDTTVGQNILAGTFQPQAPSVKVNFEQSGGFYEQQYKKYRTKYRNLKKRVDSAANMQY